MLKRMKRVYSFVRYNRNRHLSLEVLCLSFFYRLCIISVPMKILQKHFGAYNEESGSEETFEKYRQALKISYIVNRVCGQTPWKSKCFVRALTARYLLKKQKIASTLYLGVGKEGNDMIAHAWLRSGGCYLTGGRGEGYAVVAKFRT